MSYSRIQNVFWTLWLVALVQFGLAAFQCSAASVQAGTIIRDCPQCPEIVVVPAGDFLMGTSPADMERDISIVPVEERTAMVPYITKGAEDYMRQEMPQHPVHITRPFGLGKFPVTRGEFAAFVHETGYTASGNCTVYSETSRYRYREKPGTNWQNPGFDQSDHDPVVCVSAHDAEAYIAWLNVKADDTAVVKENALYRLPSESEWEYAARAGTQTAYWWGNLIGSNNAVCQGCGSRWDNKQPSPVGSFHPNLFGLYDMLGNVWELTADCWNNNYLGAPTDGTPWTTGDCGRRVARGSCWHQEPWTLRVSDRGSLALNTMSDDHGFRVVRTLP